MKGFQGLATTAISDVLDLGSVMRYAIHPLWPDIPRIAGPAFTVRTAHHDNLMLHAAIYRAEPGDVIVVEAGDESMAVAGGNVCASAQKRGVAGFIVDGVIRDIGESRATASRSSLAGARPSRPRRKGRARSTIRSAAAASWSHPGDLVVADDEGIVVVPRTPRGRQCSGTPAPGRPGTRQRAYRSGSASTARGWRTPSARTAVLG